MAWLSSSRFRIFSAISASSCSMRRVSRCCRNARQIKARIKKNEMSAIANARGDAPLRVVVFTAGLSLGACLLSISVRGTEPDALTSLAGCKAANGLASAVFSSALVVLSAGFASVGAGLSLPSVAAGFVSAAFTSVLVVLSFCAVAGWGDAISAIAITGAAEPAVVVAAVVASGCLLSLALPSAHTFAVVVLAAAQALAVAVARGQRHAARRRRDQGQGDDLGGRGGGGL